MSRSPRCPIRPVTAHGGANFRAPGQPNGPGVTVIDVEPNTGDYVDDILISGNHIDASDTPLDAGGPKVNNGIAVNGGNPTKLFRGVRVVENTVVGARHAQPSYNLINYSGILLRAANDTEVSRNTVRRVSRGIVVDTGSTDFRIVSNTLISTGSGSTEPISIENSTGGLVASNELRNEPGDALNLGDRALNIVEAGSSDSNQFRANRGKVHAAGRRSRVN